MNHLPFPLSRETEILVRAVARREMDWRELRSWIEDHIIELYDGQDPPSIPMADAALDILYQHDYYGPDGEAVILAFCGLAGLAYAPLPLTGASAGVIHVETAFR